MGRNDKQYSISLNEQLYQRLSNMKAFGQSKAEAIANGTAHEKIFSYATYQTYSKQGKYFTNYVKEHHPQCTTLNAAEKYIPEFLNHQIERGLSNWTIQTQAKALGKIYGIQPGDKNYFQCPPRQRENISRSRSTAARDLHFSKTNNAELISFCQGTGLRRMELENLKGMSVVTVDQIEKRIKQYAALKVRTKEQEKALKMARDTHIFKGKYKAFVFVKSGKGGRMRLSPIIGPDADKIIARIRNTPKDKKVWEHVHSNADIHSYRSDYARLMYKENARDIKDIPYDTVNRGTGKAYRSGVYSCRRDEAGKKLDKLAMRLCSKALGHNRLDVVASYYLHGI